MRDRLTENARTLASLLGIETEKAARLLDIALVVTFDERDSRALVLANHVQKILARTVRNVPLNLRSGSVAAEVVIGSAPSRFSPTVRVQISADAIQVGGPTTPVSIWPDAPPVLLVIAACYSVGMALKVALGTRLPINGPSPTEGLRIPISAVLGSDITWVSQEFELSDTYLAGAGAIGNGFLYGLAELHASGNLVIVDPDVVSDGNLNRCVWFSESDIGLHKAARLVDIASPHFPQLKLIPKIATVQGLGKGQLTNTWLKRLIVAVDSRRTRRHLQLEVPWELFDASTTGVLECVLHSHEQPTDTACMACVYHESPDELARERHIAEALGVELDDVKEHHISANAAERIHAKYSHSPVEQIVGNAYDSLFKALCSEGVLLSTENRQVLAPFAFVSVLAGTFLAIELGRRLVLGRSAGSFNYWRFSPWAAPIEELKQLRPRHPECEFCSEPALLRTVKELWGATR